MRALCLVRYPEGAPRATDFELRELPDAAPGDGDVVVKVTHLSMDPLPRARMQGSPPFGPPMRLGAPVEGRGVGQVVESRCAGLSPGDWVTGELGWRTRAVLPGSAVARVNGGPPHAHLNALGPTGLAAWFVVERLALGPGETLLVAPAAGAVGSLVCQIAGHLVPELRIVGGVVGEAQALFVRGMGFETIDSRSADWPGLGGVDAVVDGVGGAFHDRALAHLNPRGRVLLLGYVAGYGDAGPPRYGNAGAILMKRARMEGFLLADHMDRAEEARARLAGLLEAGHIRPGETIHHGLASAAAAFAGLFGEAPPGKQIVELESI